MDELVDHRERLRASMAASGPVRFGVSDDLGEEPIQLLFDFYAWSAHDFAGRLADKPEVTERLRRVLR